MGKLIAALCGAIFGSIFTVLTVRNLADDVMNQVMDSLTKDDETDNDAAEAEKA